METNQTVRCPHCGNMIDVSEALTHSLEEKIRSELQQQITKQQTELKQQQAALAEERTRLEQTKQRENELFQERLNKKLAEEKAALEKTLRAKAAADSAEQLNALNEELKLKSQALIEMKRLQADFERVKREKDELREQIALEKERELTEKLQQEKQRIRELTEQEFQMKLHEKEKQMEDQRKLIEEMKRKAEQGSMQLQGEVMELQLEDLLRKSFPTDVVEEVAKGKRGADCVQRVRNQLLQDCGSIIYESKRTKAFSNEWIDKLKDDMRAQKADLAVLVTEAMPKELTRFGQLDGVWVCTFAEVKGVALVLRDSLLRISQVLAAQDNKGDKMQMLYNYLTGQQFQQRIVSMVETYNNMQEELLKERKAIIGIWEKRQKQLDRMMENTVGLYGALRGIAGASIPEIPQLGLGDDN